MEPVLDWNVLLQIWWSGGWVMVPLFALAVVLYAQAFQLVLYVRRAKLDDEGEVHWWEWIQAPEHAIGRVRQIVEYTQDDVKDADQVRNRFEEVRLGDVNLIDRRVRFVSTLVAAAPLLGLLGTVLGMLQTFFGLSTSGGGETAGVVAAGISEALVTTQAGLIIALPGLFLVMMIQRQRQDLVAKFARLENLTLSYLKFS